MNKPIRYFAGITCFLLLIGCSRTAKASVNETGLAYQIIPASGKIAVSSDAAVPNEAEVSLPQKQIIKGPVFALSAQTVRPGDPITVAYSDNIAGPGPGTASETPGGTASGNGGPRNMQAVLFDSRERRVAKAAFFSLPGAAGEPEIKAAILALPTTVIPGNAVIRIESADGIIKDLPIVIAGREFIFETIALDQENTDLRTVQDPQKTAESEQLWAVISRTGTEIYSTGPFIPPVNSTRRTSFFGDRRVYSYIDGSNDTTIHAGIDYGVPKGTEVRACAAGRVVLARPRIVTGNSVVVEHMPGLYSLYYHLDQINVRETDMVETGTLLGLSGSTGLATGPHLHWEIRVSTESADPDAFVSSPILDKNVIIDKLEIGNQEL